MAICVPPCTPLLDHQVSLRWSLPKNLEERASLYSWLQKGYIGLAVRIRLFVLQQAGQIYHTGKCHLRLKKVRLPLLWAISAELFQNPVHSEKVGLLVEPCCGSVTGPLIRTWVLDHCGPDGVKDNVPAQFEEIGLPINDYGFEPPLQHMPNPAMPTVERLGVDAVELAHGVGKIGIRRLNQQMKVIGHQAIGMANQAEPTQGQTEGLFANYMDKISLRFGSDLVVAISAKPQA